MGGVVYGVLQKPITEVQRDQSMSLPPAEISAFGPPTSQLPRDAALQRRSVGLARGTRDRVQFRVLHSGTGMPDLDCFDSFWA